VLEVLLLAEELGYSVVATALALSAAEAVVEFISSSLVPLLYRLMHGTAALTSRGLVAFTLEAYFWSSIFGLLCYPFFIVVSGVMGVKTPLMFLCFALVQLVQYPLLNQLGDQAVEMATPHWLATFDGLVLVSPGWQLIDKCKLHKAGKLCCRLLCCGPTTCICYALCCVCIAARSLSNCLCGGEKGSADSAKSAIAGEAYASKVHRGREGGGRGARSKSWEGGGGKRPRANSVVTLHGKVVPDVCASLTSLVVGLLCRGAR